MIIKLYNTYHNTTEFVEGSLEKVKKENEEMLKITAENLAENEVEEDWELYYKSYEEAFEATYNDIFLTLCSEIEYSIVE